MGEANPFLKAIEVLRERGWHQGNYFDRERGGVCLWGALNAACGQEAAIASRTSLRLLEFAEDEVGHEYDTHNFVSFNDDPSTSQEDVELLLKKAAQAWSEREDASCEQ